MSVQVNKGAVKFKSIASMSRSLAAKTGEKPSRVYIRLWKRMKEAGMSASEAFHVEKRQYNMVSQ